MADKRDRDSMKKIHRYIETQTKRGREINILHVHATDAGLIASLL